MMIRHFTMELSVDLLTYLCVIRRPLPVRAGSQGIERRGMQAVRIDSSF